MKGMAEMHLFLMLLVSVRLIPTPQLLGDTY
jgi:hypothetical protein